MKLFYGEGRGGGGWVKMSVTMVGRKHWLKGPKAVPRKTKFPPEYDSKSRIWNSFLENTISSIKLFYIRLHVPKDIIRIFLISGFPAKSQRTAFLRHFKSKWLYISVYLHKGRLNNFLKAAHCLSLSKFRFFHL